MSEDKYQIRLAERDDEIERCYPVMTELRPDISVEGFIEQVRRQMISAGYRILFVEMGTEVVGVAGFRISECLAWGKFLYVDDLVTRLECRSEAYGKILLSWLIDFAKNKGCRQFHLDSGVQRHDAHRFYFQEGLYISSYHFSLNLL